MEKNLIDMQKKIDEFLLYIKLSPFEEEHDKLKKVMVPNNLLLVKSFLDMGIIKEEDIDAHLKSIHEDILLNSPNDYEKYEKKELDELKNKLRNLLR